VEERSSINESEQSLEEGYRGDDSSVAGTESITISTVFLVDSSDMLMI